MSTLLGDATLLWVFHAILGAAFCYAELREHGWFTEQNAATDRTAALLLHPGASVSVKRGETSWNFLDFAFGIMAVNVLQIINGADDTVKFKVLMSTFDLCVMIRLFFFNGWSRNKIIGFVSKARSMNEGTRSMPAEVRASHEAEAAPPPA
jgi:hypothetical protein